jgi:hypothetical protein
MFGLLWKSEKKTKTVETCSRRYERPFVVHPYKETRTLMGRKVKYNIFAKFPFIPFLELRRYLDCKPVGFGIVKRSMK